MKKHKNTPTSHSNITTMFGYSIFTLLVLSFLVSTAIPLGAALTNPMARHFNIIVMVVTFAIATLLPALASYCIGDRATHAKNKSLHHYNGVLFGVAAYWIAQTVSWVGVTTLLSLREPSLPVSLVVNNVIPVILTLIIMILVAVAYAKQHKNTMTVLQFKPFQIVLLTAVIGAFVVPYIGGQVDVQFLALSLATLLVPLAIVVVGYKVLARYQKNTPGSSFGRPHCDERGVDCCLGYLAVY